MVYRQLPIFQRNPEGNMFLQNFCNHLQNHMEQPWRPPLTSLQPLEKLSYLDAMPFEKYFRWSPRFQCCLQEEYQILKGVRYNIFLTYFIFTKLVYVYMTSRNTGHQWWENNAIHNTVPTEAWYDYERNFCMFMYVCTNVCQPLLSHVFLIYSN